MEVGESVAVQMESDLKCPIEHEEPATINSQPAKSKKDVETLKRNMRDGKSTILYGLDDDGKIVDKGLQVLVDKEPTPVPDIIAKNGALPIKIGDLDLPVSAAAHHVIPGKDSLPKSDLAKYVWKSEGEISGDIGYHVDGAENGVWLPTHQKLSSGMGKAGTVTVPSKKDPSALVRRSYRYLSKLKDADHEAASSFILSYTQLAMNLLNGQFHDAHKDYSAKIMEMLGTISLWIDKASGDNCEDCKKARTPDGKLPPPHFLVLRLNALSRRVRGWLTGPPTSWKDGYFTSDYARQYKEIEEAYQEHIRARNG